MKPAPAAEPELHDRVVHIEGEVGSIHLALDRLTKTLEKMWEKIDGLSTRGQPSWQAIVAFGFSGISALVTIGGVIGVVIAMFVRQETQTLSVRLEAREKFAEEVGKKLDFMREEKIAEQRQMIRDLSAIMTR